MGRMALTCTFITNGHNDSLNAGSINYIAGFSSNGNETAYSFQTKSAASGGNWDRRMVMQQNGQIKIGSKVSTGVNSDYKLAMYGKITANSLYILADNTTNWADYVFADNYRLTPLPELETYLKANRHLPEIPTTCDVENEGINVGAMNTLLLKKVEELALHLIELNKKVTRLEAAQAVRD